MSPWIDELNTQLLRRKHIVLFGNVHDQFLHSGTYENLTTIVGDVLRQRGFEIIVGYDFLDGYVFQESRAHTGIAAQARFQEVVRESITRRESAPVGRAVGSATTSPAVTGRPPGGQLGARANGLSLRRTPREAFGELRLGLSQDSVSVAAVVNLADLLTAESDRYPEAEREALALLKKCTLEAEILRRGSAMAGYRNTIIAVAGDIRRVPHWLYRENPLVSLIHVDLPSREERLCFVSSILDEFFWTGRDAPEDPAQAAADRETVTAELGDLTAGMHTLDLEALRVTSHTARISLRPREVSKLVDFFKFGHPEDPWSQLDATKVRTARETLQERVIGQPSAIDSVVDMLTSAQVGLSIRGGPKSGRPKGIFFFVGPTGVGKTELAKALTELVFGDEKAFARFDMSEYKEEHAAEKLAGAPPGFVGFDDGGQLTNRVMRQPHSILLFDEIEKAHPRVLDKFLQILEDGRLTDGRGQTAYFGQTAIVFTSNIGSSDITDIDGRQIRPGIMSKIRDAGCVGLSYDEVKKHFKDEVEWHFATRIGRAELLNRLGDNVVVFDVLRPEFVGGIARKFLAQLALTAKERLALELSFSEQIEDLVRSAMRQDSNLLYGGRRIATLLETLVERPLNRLLFESHSRAGLAGKHMTAFLDDSGAVNVRIEAS